MNILNHVRTMAIRLFVAGQLLTSAASALAEVRYVDVNSTNAAPPYTSWATAATNIQEAVDAAIAGDEILVTNGIYATGGSTVNRVVVDKPVKVQSVSGPQFTVIEGDQWHRCVSLANNASLSGFTLTQGFADYGGGAFCAPMTALNNCILFGNSASYGGGGAYGGTLNNCTLTDNNSALISGGALWSTLNNCTLIGNSASYGDGGAYGGTLNNCIVYFNTAPQDANYGEPGTTLNYCCTTPLPTNGVGNITSAPLFIDLDGRNLRLQSNSSCINAGWNALVPAGPDLDGNSRISGGTVDSGAYEFQNPQLTGPLSVTIAASFTNVATGFALEFTGFIEGRTTASAWNFGDGTAITNQLLSSHALVLSSHAWKAPGDYVVFMRAYNDDYPGGISATVGVHVVTQPVSYVATVSTNPLAPYTSWTTAATNIQDAVDAATVAGALVLVTNGTYGPITVGKSLTLRSLNGPQYTTIDGSHSNRCVSLGSAAGLSGFTLTNGFAHFGGGLWCESTNAMVSNCVVSGNSVSASAYVPGNITIHISVSGGGAYGGTLDNCILSGNHAFASVSGGFGEAFAIGGGAYGCILNNCTLTGNGVRVEVLGSYGNSYGEANGGGAFGCILNNCTLMDNTASEYGGSAWGGGAADSTVNNCALSANFGGGAWNCTLNNCTLTGNPGGGAYYSTLNNCIAYFNPGENYDSYSTLNYSCTTPQPTNGVGNFSLDPQLASASHLSTASPCRGAGSVAYARGTDIDGEPWASPPSIGCDEYHAAGLTGPLSVGITASFTNVTVGYSVQLTALIEGRTAASVWDFGDGVTATNQPYISHAWTALGDYAVVLLAYNESQPDGISATVIVHVVAGVHYVASDSTNPVAPYTSWTTAATNIQDAVEAATVPGAIVLVTNGTYAPITVYNKILTVRSVNGPLLTAINGGRSNQCVFLSNDASLSGFTLTNGSSSYGGGASGGTLSNCTITGNSANDYGGGAWNCTLNNCTLTGNCAEFGGGGASGGTLSNCTITGNSANDYGGGAWNCTLNNCTLTGNSATTGGGVYYSTLNNCIVYFNIGSQSANYDTSSTLNYSCTTPQPTNGLGNISSNPQLASVSHLSAGSPCRGAGSAAYATGSDIDGEAWENSPSIGCDEYHAGAVTGPLSVAIAASFTYVQMDFTVQLTALIEGRTAASSWDFGDGTAATNQPYTSHAWTALGDYAVVLRAFNESQPGRISATVTIHVVARPVHYVASDSTNTVAPYTSWTTAATNIQDAVEAATVPGAIVLVTNGTYAPITVYNKILTVRSVNGPLFTIINGGQSNSCVSLGNGASLSGFTLTNGSSSYGGGASGGTLSNCTITGNSAYYGGGADGCTLYNCTLSGNSANGYGGGAHVCTLNNCTLALNSATDGGGAGGSTLNNCIVYFNNALNGANCDSWSTLNYSCTTPLPTLGFGNITKAPRFLDQASGNLRLQSNSSCINAGLNAFAPTGHDLDGNPRIAGGTVDIGAYQFQSPASMISYAWLQQFGLPTDGLADTIDSDDDGLNNWQEWRCGTDPTNAGSVLRLLAPVPAGSDLILRWESVADRTYFVERSMILSSPFTPLAANIPGQIGTTTYTDTNAIGAGPWFYRVGVSSP